jgi:hypothetical protein
MKIPFNFYKGDMAIGELYDTFKGNDGEEAVGLGDREATAALRCIVVGVDTEEGNGVYPEIGDAGVCTVVMMFSDPILI